MPYRSNVARDDVWGALLEDVAAGRPAMEVVERDDGYVMAFDNRYLLAPFRKWDDPVERRAMRFVKGRVLDVSCGGGRVCLHLQKRGLDVVGIDSSPGAIAVCRRRGVRDARVLRASAIDESLGVVDTAVLLGQNLGCRGSSCLRVRHRELSSDWFDWLQVAQPELVELLEGTGWQMSTALGDGPSYVAIIDRMR